jgi:uncharacterized membrane protein YhaH (DUF805 family)
MDYLINLFKQSLKPYGSINRLDFWVIILINYGLLPLIILFFSKFNTKNILVLIPLLIWGLLFSYITFVNSRKRLHDAGFSSLWLLLIFLGMSISKGVRPENYSGFIFLIQCLAFIPFVMLFFPSKLTNNKYRLS